MGSLSRRDFTGQVTQGTLAASVVGSSILAGTVSGQAARRKIKIGQIGTQHAHASGKIETLRKLTEDFEVVGVVEPDPERRKEVENEDAYRGVTWMTEERLLNSKGLEAVAVETGVPDLVPTASRCIAAGLHVHLDKPAGESLAAFRKLLDESVRKNLVVQMGYMFRYSPAFQLCFQAVREGWLGDLFEAHAVISKKVGADRRIELAESLGGSMFELGCHLIDALVYVLGKPERVTAHVRNTRPEQDTLADNQLAVLEYRMATATVRSALVEPFGFRRRQFVICGDEGIVDIRPLEPPKLLLALTEPRQAFQKGYQEVELPPSAGRYDGDFSDLAQIVRGQKAPDFTPDHDLAVQETILRASGLSVD